MMKNCALNSLVSFLLTVALCSSNQISATVDRVGVPTWCVAAIHAPEDKLQQFIDFGCSKFDCSPIQPGGACYAPNVPYGHGSWVLDKYYRLNGVCQKGLGVYTTSSPSYEKCQYP